MPPPYHPPAEGRGMAFYMALLLGFLLFATILAWFAKKQVWADVKPKRRKD